MINDAVERKEAAWKRVLETKDKVAKEKRCIEVYKEDEKL